MPDSTRHMITGADAASLLLKVAKAAGGVTAWCRTAGLTPVRSNVENMAKGKIKVSPVVAEAMGLRRVLLEIYIEPGGSLPPEFEPFVIERKPISGRPKKSARVNDLLRNDG